MQNSKSIKSDKIYTLAQAILIICLIILTFNQFIKASEIIHITHPNSIVPIIINDDPNFDNSSIEIYKYHNNIIQNNGSGEININGKSIEAGKIDSVLINNEEIVSITTSKESFMIQTRENTPHNITLQKIISMSGEDIKLSAIQKVTGFRITITDDFADQLDYQILGPVTYKIAKRTNDKIVIDISLNAYRSEEEFNTYAQKDAFDKYTSVFNITVKDNIAPYTFTDKGTFTYTEW